MRPVWTCWCAVVWCARAAAADGEAVRAALAAGGRYSVRSALLLNSAERRDRELGYRLSAELDVTRLPPPPDRPHDTMLCFTLWGTVLEVRGRAEWAARGSPWDAQRGPPSTWCALVHRGGALGALLLHPGDPPSVRDYKRALAALFQFQGSVVGDAWETHNETDPLGSCLVSYERAGGGGVRKVRRACAGDAAAGAAARRVARLQLAPGPALAALHAEELLTLHDALKARSYHTLERLPSATSPPAPAAAPASLRPHPLPLEATAPLDPEEGAPAEVEVEVEEEAAALGGEGPGEGGTAAAARALARLLPALRRADGRRLQRALERADRALLPALCRALGLAGSAAAARAALAFSRLAASDPLEPLARAFLQGFTLASAAERDAVLEVVRAAGEARREPLARAALAAAAAAARGERERALVREAATRALARCRDEEACRAAGLRALAHLRAAPPEGLAAALLAPGRAGAAAVAAARAAPSPPPALLERLARLAENRSAPLEARAAALDALVVRRVADATEAGGAAPLRLLRLAEALHAERGPAAHELRRVLWQRLDALEGAAAVRALRRLLPPRLRSWDARAAAGTSSVMVRETGWGGAAGGWRAVLDAVQVAGGGMVRRALVALHLRPPPAAPPAPPAPRPPELEVEVWTRGLHALAGGAPDDGREEGEGVAGGLALSVAGYTIQDVALFQSQTELLGHVWAGTGSAPQGVVRALREAHRSRAVLPLLAGGVLHARADVTVALALDAHAAVSLWQRTARGALALRAGVVARAAASVRVAWGELHAEREFSAEPRLRIALALDFYDGVAACVRASVPEHAAEDALRTRAALGARPLAVRRGASARRPVPARTLSLGRRNDAACRSLLAADDDHDDHDHDHDHV